MYVSDKQDHAYSKAIDRIKGFDFAPFEGIDGVYVANSYADKTAMKNGVATTSITYDNGAHTPHACTACMLTCARRHVVPPAPSQRHELPSRPAQVPAEPLRPL